MTSDQSEYELYLQNTWTTRAPTAERPSRLAAHTSCTSCESAPGRRSASIFPRSISLCWQSRMAWIPMGNYELGRIEARVRTALVEGKVKLQKADIKE